MMIKDFTPRLYQQTILGTAAANNTLAVLPTGLGKTALAFLLAAQRFNLYPQMKVLMLAPTKPLCEQHAVTFQKHLDMPESEIVVFTGSVKPEKRAELWKTAKVIISTPQGLENDVINGRIALAEVSLLIFDEAHHATKDYAYVWLAEQYDLSSKAARILALTASPGSDLEKITEICRNLKIEKVEVRTEKDPDVREYIQKIKINWDKVVFPELFKPIQKNLLDCKRSKLLAVQQLGYCNTLDLSKGQLLELQSQCQNKLNSGFRDFALLRSVSLIAEALKVEHASELLETQGLTSLEAYFQKIYHEALSSKIKAVKNLSLDPFFKFAADLTSELISKNIEHPKLVRLLEIVQLARGAKVIVFTQFRHSAEQIVKKLSSGDISSQIFVGQTKRNGLGFSQKQQREILDKFRAGEFNVLVATSVAEEGLDIPKVDKVIFYEPIPSAIRTIQRRGRTGRLESGEVTILVTEGTRDETYRWASHHKEKRMHRNLDQLKKGLSLQPTDKPTLQRFLAQDKMVVVLADHREKDNKVVKELINLGLSVRTKQLNSADYILSGTVGVELKKVPDFVNSIIDGRLLDQVKELRQNFQKAILVIEGEEDLYAVRNVHANAIRGMLSSIVLDFKIPVLYTKDSQDTAALLAVMAHREQDGTRDFSYHEKKPISLVEQLEFIVSSFPTIGVVNARNLLRKFNSIKSLVNAGKQELTEVEGIGEKTAEKLIKLFEEKYEKEK
ncbi:MAG TPA: DEAD/DEAH box helicase [Candidatus Nanoarchaeia archaeon]|nr:DEAD/DEAH box helicase [Candidatus Nanoarchaeia archaeon]